MGLAESKQEYNVLIAREKKAEAYMKTATEKEQERWMPEFRKLLVQLSLLIKEIQEVIGRKMTSEEALNGFKEVQL